MSESGETVTGREARASEAVRAASSPAYNAAVAMAFFRGAGKPQDAAPGTVLFSAGEKTAGLFSRDDRMYLVLEGEVVLQAGDYPLATVKAGELFGEMAAITHEPRTASAIARTRCRLIALDGRQFEQGLAQNPEFALMLMGVFSHRIRQTAAVLAARAGVAGAQRAQKPAPALDRTMMTGLRNLLRERTPARYAAGQTIFRQGESAAFMYVVSAGTVAILADGHPIERVGPGGLFGEMAIVDQSPRSAAAQAETDCELMALNRNDFLALVRTSPSFGRALLRAMAARLAAVTAQLA
ncbi:MAG: cyclic nucleotide-binding domain-containing protein [Burkholderiales bacterium]|nr:cyclic nucleotide-binding domain-containing protein [Burkholderiales bacterium]